MNQYGKKSPHLIPRSEEIAAARIDAELSRQGLSIHSGVSVTTIANLERGVPIRYQMKTARRICMTLNRTLYDLFLVNFG